MLNCPEEHKLFRQARGIKEMWLIEAAYFTSIDSWPDGRFVSGISSMTLTPSQGQYQTLAQVAN